MSESIVVLPPPSMRHVFVATLVRAGYNTEWVVPSWPYLVIHPGWVDSIKEAKSRKVHYFPKRYLKELQLIPKEAIIEYIKTVSQE